MNSMITVKVVITIGLAGQISKRYELESMLPLMNPRIPIPWKPMNML